jgi:hypothetical protein
MSDQKLACFSRTRLEKKCGQLSINVGRLELDSMEFPWFQSSVSFQAEFNMEWIHFP